MDAAPQPKITSRLTWPAADVSDDGQCLLEVHDLTLLQYQATFTLTREIKVNRHGGKTVSQELFRWTGRLDGPRHSIPVPRAVLDEAYLHVGQHTTTRIESKFVVDDGYFSDTTFVDQIGRPLPIRRGGEAQCQELVRPQDEYHLLSNLVALPLHRRAFTGVLIAVALVIGGINTLIGVHDQFTSRANQWVYSHRGTDATTRTPILDSLLVTGGVGAAVAAAIMVQLRGYMSFRLKSQGLQATPDLRLPIGELIEGTSRVKLENATLRVVAVNYECGKYTVKRKSSKGRTTTSTRTLHEPVRAIVLYEQTQGYIPAREPLGDVFTGEVDFAPLFQALYPPMARDGHGLDLTWEVQLLVPLYVDQKIVGPPINAPLSAYHTLTDSPLATSSTAFADLA